MILAFLHYAGSSPLSNDVWKRSNILSFTAGHICFHTMAGSPSSPGAFHDFAIKILLSTSSIIRGGIGTGVRYGRDPSSSIIVGSGGKKADKSSSTYSILSLVLDPSLLVNGGILSNTKLPLGSKYLAACHIFVSSARKSSQYAFFYLRTAS
jgi:hypothetical protein